MRTRPALAVVLVGAVVLAAVFWGVRLYRIPGAAMQPALKPGDRLAVSRFHLVFGEPERGDLVALHAPARARDLCGQEGTYVYRVVALPREVVAQRAGAVYVNGRRLREPYLARRRDAFTYPPRRVPRDHYFVMGDNRTQACDSRVWGAISDDALVGVVVAVYWPRDRIGLR